MSGKKNSPKENKKEKSHIIVRGAKVNNLRNIDVDIPRDKFVVITGLSGSGKSSLAFDTIYAEGNRRYMEGLSSYARNFLDVSSKPEVDKIENLSPTISIDQKSVVRSPRSTVGTLTEIYDYLRILFAKVGDPHCLQCGALMEKKEKKEIIKEILSNPSGTQIAILSRYGGKEKNPKDVLRQIQQLGYARVRFENKIKSVSEALMIVSEKMSIDIDIVVDRIELNKKNLDEERISDSIETALKLGDGSMIILVNQKKELQYNQEYICQNCRTKIKEITPRHFSFNNPEGACCDCSGLGIKMEIDPDLIIPNKKLSLAEGAIRPWSKAGGRMGENGYGMMVKDLARKYGFSLNMPIGKLSARNLNIILQGESVNDLSQARPENKFDGAHKLNSRFQGVIPILEGRYLETNSDYVRNEIEKYMIAKICSSCEGKRLKREYLNVLIDEKSIDDFVSMSISHLKEYLQKFIEKNKSIRNQEISEVLIREIIERLVALENVGLEYLSLSRGTKTISGGEAQRIRLAVQIKSQLMGIIYVLDEPSIGLHSRDTEKLIKTIKSLRDEGNSLVVVEHDSDFIREADWVIDMGPGAGEEGGKLIFQGDYESLKKSKTSTALYISGKKKVSDKKKFRSGNKNSIEVIKACEHNLKDISVKIPLEKFVVVCGVSGSGKSTLVNDILAKALSKHFYGARASVGKHKELKGIENVNKVINISQSPIGRTPRSNAATYTGLFSHIREIFAQTEESQNRGYTSSRFSFNMKGGRCEVCQGDGMRKIEMHLLPDMYVKCEVCGGTRYNKKTLEIEYQGVNIADVLDMSVNYAMIFFKRYPLIYEKLRTMDEVGLGYLKLGQSATNLSGGEAQRIKLATELARKSTGKTLYILDEPTIGLHFADVRKLLQVLDALVDKGNTVVTVEHNIDVIRNADWVIELGPDGGDKGGKIVFQGTPDKLKKNKKSWTGRYL
ncbi:MAG: excinuclease ABC subunit UvrA [Candidatus Moranbacteria bacterium]|jgi:excinuclease ABC subunit A|nr:excinuclease ABC subunit UvrA [Candidatus Moranbacteria bacterium]